MKKFFMCAMAAVAMLSVSSCLSEEELNLTRSEKTGTINVKISTDNALVTRTTQNVADPTAWFAFIDGTSKDFGSAETHASISGLSAETFPFGNYNVTVSNFANEAAAYEVNTGFGAAYYEGTAASQKVEAGKNTSVEIACGKAQNAKFNIEYSGFEGTDAVDGGLYFVSVVAVNAATTRSLTFTSANKTTDAFFIKDETVSYTVNWKYNGTAKSATGTITMAGRGTANKLSISSNANGTITIAATTGITYEDDYNAGNTSTVTVSAETGEKL